MARDHWTPLSILIGSSVIAIGLYLGLRDRPAAVPPAQTASAAVSGLAPQASSNVAQAPGQVTGPVAIASDAANDEAAKNAVESLRQQILAKCWAPHKADKELPKHISITYSGAFDAQGKEIGRGLSDSRDAYYSPVSQCARAIPMDLHIASPGKNISVVLPMELP